MDQMSVGSSAEEKPPNETPGSSGNEKADDGGRFECNICFEPAKDAVVSLCGHLFCWPCLSKWLDTKQNNSQFCPICKSAIDSNKVVPIYGRGGDSTDPRKKVPPRPKGQRSEVPPQSFPGFQWGGGEGMGGTNVQFSFGIGIFPLSFVASWFNPPLFGGAEQQENGGRAESGAAPGSRQYQEEQYLSNIFMYIGVFMLFWVLLV